MALDRLTKVDGGGISTTSDYRVGIITATKFVGPIEGDVTGAITATDGTFSGNVSIAGTLTYEDVTNIDSVGIITAQKDIHVGAGVSVVGVGTFGSLDISGNIDVDGHTNLDNVSIAGVSTFTGQLNAGAVEVNSTINVIGESTFRDRIQLVDGTPEILLSVPSGGLDSRILNDGSGNLIIGHGINSDTPTERLRIASTGNVTIHKDLDVDGHTNLDNVSIAGVSTHSDHIHLLDDKRLRLGSAVNGDAVLLHNGTDTILDNQTGGLLLRSGTHKLQALNANDMIVGNTGGSVELYHNNLRKLSTTSTGIEIHANEANNANIYMTADEGDDNGDEWILQSQASTNNFNFYNNTSGSAAVKLSIKPNGDVGFTGDLLVPENITHSGDTNTRIRFPANDTISFETAGDERLRIQSDGTVRFYNSIFGGDNKPIYLGNANDLSLFHDSGGASIIRYNHSVGGLHFRNNSNADQMIIDSSGNVDIATGQLTISNDIKSSDDDFYVYSYKGGNDGQVRSGIQYDGNSQRLRFFTGTNERLRVKSNGQIILGNVSNTGGVSNSTLHIESGGMNVESQYDTDDLVGSPPHLTLSGQSTRVRMDMGTMSVSPYAGWIQARYDNHPFGNSGTDDGLEPLVLNPVGGALGINVHDADALNNIGAGMFAAQGGIVIRAGRANSTTVNNASTAIKIFPGEVRAYSGSGNVGEQNQGTKYGGIAWNVLDPQNGGWGGNHTGHHCWMGMSLHSTPAQEKSNWQVQMNSFAGAGSFATNVAIQANPEGYVTHPNQPCMSVGLNRSDTNIGGGSDLFQTFSSVMFYDVNQGNIAFTSSNGRFTVPIDGNYMISFYSIKNGSGVQGYADIRVNGVNGSFLRAYSQNNATSWSAYNAFGIKTLSKGDYINVVFPGSAANWNAHGAQHLRLVIALYS